MRVTENTNYEVVREGARRSKERMESLQRQNSTLKKVNTPSDDPVGAAKILEMRTEKVIGEQFQSNAKLAETFLANTDQALEELSELMLRAKDIALSQSSGPSTSEGSRLGVAEEVQHLYQQAISVANRRVGDRYIFGGYKTHRPPVDVDGKYLGDPGKMMIEVGREVFVNMNVPGNEAFNSRPRDSELIRSYELESQGRAPASVSPEQNPYGDMVNVFNELKNLRVFLLTGDIEGIQGTLERFDQAHAHLVSMRSKIGSRIQGLQNSAQSIDRHNIQNAQLSSQIEDADMAQVVSDLAREETVFRSALQSSQKLIRPTLLDFLR